MSPDHWSKLTWDTVSAGGYDLLDPIGYLDRKRDRAYKQRVIVTPAVALKIMISIYGAYAYEFSILFNPRKSKLMYFNVNLHNLDITLCGEKVIHCDSETYLGVSLNSNITDRTMTQTVCSFYQKSNHVIANYSMFLVVSYILIGYEPADLTVHPPPQNDRGWVHFFRIGV